MSQPHPQITAGTTRQGRRGERFRRLAARHDRFVGFTEARLPRPAARGDHLYEHPRRRGGAVAAHVFVVPEHNHTTKNALDHLHTAWCGKPAAFAGRGAVAAGERTGQALRPPVVLPGKRPPVPRITRVNARLPDQVHPLTRSAAT